MVVVVVAVAVVVVVVVVECRKLSGNCQRTLQCLESGHRADCNMIRNNK